jgi:hypothetical protein
VCEIFGLGPHHPGVSSLEMALPGVFRGGAKFLKNFRGGH